MRTLLKLNKFNRRYEVDLFGNVGQSHNTKMLRFVKNLSVEKVRIPYSLRRTGSGWRRRTKKAYRDTHPERESSYLKFFKFKNGINPARKIIQQSFEYRQKKKRFKRQSFVYRIDIEEPRRRRLKTTFSRDLFLINRKLRSFYANIKRLQLRRYANNSKFNFKTKQIRGFSVNNFVKFRNNKYYSKVRIIDSFLSILEHRLDMFLYRCNFVKSIFHARHLILHNKVIVNLKTVSFCSYQLRKFDVVSLNYNVIFFMKSELKKKLSVKLVLSYFPRYLLVSYKLMCGFFIKNPTLNSIPFPFKINLRRWLGLAKMDV